MTSPPRLISKPWPSAVGAESLSGLSGRHTARELVGMSPSWGHWPVLQYYQVPTVSLAEAIFPLAWRDYACPDAVSHNRTHRSCAASNPFWEDVDGRHPSAFKNLHSDSCCHPEKEGHVLVALALGHEIDAEACEASGPPAVWGILLHHEHLLHMAMASS